MVDGSLDVNLQMDRFNIRGGDTVICEIGTGKGRWPFGWRKPCGGRTGPGPYGDPTDERTKDVS